jgi:hypothetical protein
VVYRNKVCNSQETYYVSATEPNRLMLFGETVAVYCENHTEHRYSSCVKGITLRLLHRAQPVNAVYCESHREHRYSSCVTGNTLRLLYRVQPVNAVYCESHREHGYSSCVTGNTLRLRYRVQPVNAVYCESHREHRMPTSEPLQTDFPLSYLGKALGN